MIKNYGFVQPFIQPEEYVLGAVGALPKEMLQPDGQWDDYLPIYEPQAEQYETWGCTCWGTENQIEIYMKRKFDFEPNYDERFPYNGINITPPGANPQNVYEFIRDNGLLNNRPLPATYEEFCLPRPPSIVEKNEAKQWLVKYELRHQWLFYPTANLAHKQAQLVDELKSSPIGISVVAWKERNGLYCKEIGEPDTHWCVVYGYEIGAYWKVFDSYDHSMKRLEWDYDFGSAKKIFISKKEQPPKRSWWNWLCPITKFKPTVNRVQLLENRYPARMGENLKRCDFGGTESRQSNDFDVCRSSPHHGLSIPYFMDVKNMV